MCIRSKRLEHPLFIAMPQHSVQFYKDGYPTENLIRAASELLLPSSSCIAEARFYLGNQIR